MAAPTQTPNEVCGGPTGALVIEVFAMERLTKQLRRLQSQTLNTPRTGPLRSRRSSTRGSWSVLQNRIVYGENVRQTLQFA